MVIATQRRNGMLLVAVSIGSDDGLKPGHTVEVFNNSKYLGRVEILKTSPDKAVGRVDVNYQQGPIQEGDRVATRPAFAGRGQGLSDGDEAAAHLSRRVGLQHAGREPKGRCQHKPAPARPRRPEDRHADRRNQEHEQLSLRRAGNRLRS